MKVIRFIFAVAICGFVIALIGDEHLRHDVFVKVELWIEEFREVVHEEVDHSSNSYSSSSSYPPTYYYESSEYSEVTTYSNSSSCASDDIADRAIDHVADTVGHMARDIDDEVERWSDPNQFDENVARYHDAGHEAFDTAREATRDFMERDSVRSAVNDIKSIFSR
jgi:hypothetical protein